MTETMSESHYLFDTGALIDIYHGRERVKPFFEQLIEPDGGLTVYVSPVSEAELWLGLRAHELERHEALLSIFRPLPLTSEAGRLAGEWMRRFGPKGLGWMDALIVATAAVMGLPVLTRDRRLVETLAGEADLVLYG